MPFSRVYNQDLYPIKLKSVYRLPGAAALTYYKYHAKNTNMLEFIFWQEYYAPAG